MYVKIVDLSLKYPYIALKWAVFACFAFIREFTLITLKIAYKALQSILQL